VVSYLLVIPSRTNTGN